MMGKRAVTLLGAAICAVAVSACGSGEHARYAGNESTGYVELSHLNYQVQVSRELNPWDVHEDRWYLQGLTAAERRLPTTDEFFGVSLQIFNWSGRAHTPTRDFYITDTIGQRFTPLRNPSPNPYTYVPVSIPAGGQLPTLDSNAYASWSQGEMLIFKVPISSLPNRPFILHVVNPAKPSDQSEIQLDV